MQGIGPIVHRQRVILAIEGKFSDGNPVAVTTDQRPQKA